MSLKKFAFVPVICALTALSILLSGCLCSNLFSGGGIPLPSIPGVNPPSSPSATSPASSSGKQEPPNLPGVRPPGPPSPPPAGTRMSNTGSLTLGATVQMGSQPIDRAGNDLTLQAPGTPLDGMVFSVPPDAYPDTRTYKFSYTPINSTTFKNVNPVTPLITIDNGGAFSQHLIKIKIPVKVSPGQFAMGFLYDAATGKLEGMPLLARDSTSVTVGTFHFTTFFLSEIDAALLKPDIDSGFRPGIDDWQFTNYGSYIAPGGHCAGQSLTALWYYFTQPDGKDLTLYGRYDNNGQKPATPNLWADDNLGYRLASVVQNDINWDSFENKTWNELAGANDETTWQLFVYAMMVTGEPQKVGIYSSAGGGHAMIVYRAKNDSLYIADPNYPGNNDRRIEFVIGKFVPYESGANAEEIAKGNSKKYETIQYEAKTTVLDWGKIAQRWQEMKAGTIGNGTFPSYQVTYVDEKGEVKELKDGTVVTARMLELETKSSGVATNMWKVYRDGSDIKHDANWKYELKVGENLLGIEVLGRINNKDKYIDFTSRKVIYQTGPASTLTINPPSFTGEVPQSPKFTVTSAKPPAKVLYEWWLDDGGGPDKRQAGTAKTINDIYFSQPGNWTLTVKEYEVSTYPEPNRLTGTATATIVIKAKEVNRLAELQKTSGIKAGFNGLFTTRTTDYTGKTTLNNAISSLGVTLPVAWSGTSFSGKQVFGEEKPGGIYQLDEVTGSVTPDGSRLVNLKYNYRRSTSSSDGVVATVNTQKFELKDVPLWTTGKNVPEWQQSGPAIQQYVGTFERRNQTSRNGSVTASDELTGVVDWNSSSALLFIQFR